MLRSIGASMRFGGLAAVAREDRQAPRRLHRLHRRVRGVGAQHDVGAALDHLAPRLHRRQAVQRGVVDDVVLAQVVELLRQAELLDVARRGEDRHVELADPRRDELVGGRPEEADGEVGLARGEVEHLVAHDHLHDDVGMAPRELGRGAAPASARQGLRSPRRGRRPPSRGRGRPDAARSRWRSTASIRPGPARRGRPASPPCRGGGGRTAWRPAGARAPGCADRPSSAWC